MIPLAFSLSLSFSFRPIADRAAIGYCYALTMDLLSALDWIVIVRYTPFDESNAWKGSMFNESWINQNYEFVAQFRTNDRKESGRNGSMSILFLDLLNIVENFNLCKSCNKCRRFYFQLFFWKLKYRSNTFLVHILLSLKICFEKFLSNL